MEPITNHYERPEELVVSDVGLDIFSAHFLFQAVLCICVEDLVKLHTLYTPSVQYAECIQQSSKNISIKRGHNKYFYKQDIRWLVGWSLTSVFSTNTAMSETKDIRCLIRNSTVQQRHIKCTRNLTI